MDKKFTILHTEWSEGFGGQEMRILLEIKQHLKRGHQVSLLAPPDSPLSKTAEEQGIEVIPFKIRHTIDVPAIIKLIRILRAKGIEVLHTHSSVDSWVGSLAARWARVPVLIRTRHISVPVKKHPLNRVYYFPDAIITTGEHIRKDLLKTHKISAERILSIPTGVDSDSFFPRSPDFKLKKELGLPEDAAVISLVAVLRAQKRHELVIAAAPKILERHPQARFLFVGEGPGRNRIKEEIKRHLMESFFLMAGYRNDIPEILSITDIGVITSQAEGIPQFLLQAMAMAKPVVATRVGGIPEIIEDGVNGLLIPPEDPQALAEAVVRMLDDQALAKRLGEKAKELIEKKYSAAEMAEQVYQVYLKVFKEKKDRIL